METVAAPAGARSLLAAARPQVRRRLYEFYDELRAAGPCRWDRPLRSWVVTGYAAVSAAAGDPRLSSVRYTDPGPPEARGLLAMFGRQMLYRDAPDHPRLRQPVSRAFAARAVADLRPRIAAAADALLDRVAGAGSLDLVAAYAEPLPAQVICELLGIPAGDRGAVVAWSRVMAPIIGGARLSADEWTAAAAAVDALLDYLDAFLDDRPAGPAADLVAAAAAGRLSRDELLANCVLIFLGGHETTTHFIGNATVALLAHPPVRDRLVSAGAAGATGVVEELLRYDPPVHLLLRRARADLEIAGQPVAAGDTVLLVTGAANRDPAAFADPHRLDPDRAGPRHLSFGHGPHFCLGAGLARLEAEVALRRLFTRLPGLHLADSAAPLPWLANLDFRGLRRLDLHTGARPAPPSQYPLITVYSAGGAGGAVTPTEGNGAAG